jgi:glycosyltransferase involved in cell wall biosynthesis
MPPFIFSTGIPVSGDDLIWSVQRNRSLIWRTSIALHTYVFRHIENITTSSHRLKEVVVARAKINPAKITVTPFVAAEPEIFHPGIDSSDLREKLGLRPDSMLVLSLGEVSPYKNQFSLVKAMPAIIAKHANTKFVFVGALDKDYYNQIQRFVRENSLEKYIFFTGFVKDYADLPKYYNLADIYVLLSCGEGNMPKTTMEAMACGKAIIVSDIPQNREGAIRGDEMLFVNPYDISAIANAINRLLTDHDLRRQLGEKAQRTINEYYTPEMVAKLMIEVYEGIEVVPKNWTGC